MKIHHRIVPAALAAALLAGGASAAVTGSGTTLPGSAGFPESIALVPGSRTFFVSSFTTGAVFRGTVGGNARPFLPAGSDGRSSAAGVKVFGNRLFVLAPAAGRLQVFDDHSGRLEAQFGGTPAGSSLNDMAQAANGDVYITDFATPRIYRVTAQELAHRSGRLAVWLTPSTRVVPKLPATNLNGIAVTPHDRYLLVGQTANGAVYRVSLKDRSIRRVRLGGPGLTATDGMLLVGRTLYVSEHGNAVAVVTLNSTYSSGSVTRLITSPSFDFPTSVTRFGSSLLVANALKPTTASSYAVSSVPPTAGNTVAGGCQIQADATLTPLTLTTTAFSYHYSGKLFSCVYTGGHAGTSGVISAGETIRINGHLYQEPAPSGTGSCLATQTTGYDFAQWSNGTQTIVSFTTNGGAGGTHLFGTIVPRLTLKAVDPAPGDPTSAVFETDQFLGQTAVGNLSFAPVNPALCGSTGVTHAVITGLLGHVGIGS
jgi:sugar lactone lactonase YvrE